MIDMSRQVYLIFGLGGVLSKCFWTRLNGMVLDYQLYAFDHIRVDICNRNHVAPILEYLKPNIVINCASVSDAEICEAAKAGSFNVNVLGQAVVAEESARIGAKVVSMSHYSVFDGTKKTPYTEKAVVHPYNELGNTKSAGEAAVIKANSNHLILRMGWLFSSEKANCKMRDWITSAEQGQKIKVPEYEIVSPVSGADLATAAMHLIQQDAKGIYHIANEGSPSMMELAKTVIETCKLPNTIQASKDKNTRKTILSCSKYKTATKQALRPWQDAMKECLYRLGRYQP